MGVEEDKNKNYRDFNFFEMLFISYIAFLICLIMGCFNVLKNCFLSNLFT